MIAFSPPSIEEFSQSKTSSISRIVLKGDIVTMNMNRDIIPNGRLCIEGKAIVAIARTGESLPQEFQHTQTIETGGTIYPGLIDLHNHLPYNIIPLWQVDRQFQNRIEWQKIPQYYPAVSAPFGLLNRHPDTKYRRSIIRFAECRGLFGGATTGHGMALTNGAFYEGLMRNVELPGAPELPTAKSYTADFKPKQLADMLDWTGQGRPYIYHLSEGLAPYGEQVFRELQQVPGGLNPQLICIHCVGIPTDGWNALSAIAGIVWSPTSNLLLYGQTCNIKEAKQRNISIAIGADWSPSGCKNLLGELKVAREVSRHMGNVLSDEELVRGVTTIPSTMIGWEKYLGSLEAGKWADLLVLSGSGGDPYARLVEAKETSIQAVIIDGRVRLAKKADGLFTTDQQSTEEVTIGGKSYLLDLAEAGTDGVGGLKLSEAIVNIQYGLQHLPDWENQRKALATAGINDQEAEWYIEDEMHPGDFASLLTKAAQLPVEPMSLEPMTAVDDPDFAPAMQRSRNMPDYAKRAFDN